MAIMAFQGKLIAGVGKALRLYDMGKKKLLRKVENKVRFIIFRLGRTLTVMHHTELQLCHRHAEHSGLKDHRWRHARVCLLRGLQGTREPTIDFRRRHATSLGHRNYDAGL